MPSPLNKLPTVSDDASDEKPLTTGDLARACETTVRTVRFYEEAGVLRPENRTEGGHRLFGEEDLQKLKLIMDFREAGLSLNEIRRMFQLKREHDTPEAASQAMSGILEEQIADRYPKGEEKSNQHSTTAMARSLPNLSEKCLVRRDTSAGKPDPLGALWSRAWPSRSIRTPTATSTGP